MPVTDPVAFKNSTAPLERKGGVFKPGYGSNMSKVLLALQGYWDNRLGDPMLVQRLLYNLWKQCGKWLKLKQAKPQQSELSMRRQIHVTRLQNEALEELTNLNPRLAQLFLEYQERKEGGYRGNTIGLKPGYTIERQYYLSQGKRSGWTVSGSSLHTGMQSNTKQFKDLRKKKRTFENLKLSDVESLIKQSVTGATDKVTYLNKIERLKYIVSIDEGLCYNFDEELLLMNEKNWGKYYVVPYAMDKYGSLFVITDYFGGPRNVVVGHSNGRNFEVKQSTFFNHSSIVGGTDILCAGCIHIGWDARTNSEAAGVLSHIDNGSGHYKPGLDSLLRCVEVLAEDGIDVGRVRVVDWSIGADNLRNWWGDDFIAGRPRWQDQEHPTNGLPLPEIRYIAG